MSGNFVGAKRRFDRDELWEELDGMEADVAQRLGWAASGGEMVWAAVAGGGNVSIQYAPGRGFEVEGRPDVVSVWLYLGKRDGADHRRHAMVSADMVFRRTWCFPEDGVV